MSQAATTVNRPTHRAAPLILAILCGVIAYTNSYRGPFIFDDIDAIPNNPRINRTLTPPQHPAPTTLSGRPILRLSFIADYAIAELRTPIYHLTNLLIHLAAGALLFAILCRNLSSQEFWGTRFEKSAHWLAGAVTAVWLVHPLNTEAVTYIVQRAESLTGLFFLLTLYCSIRSATPIKKHPMEAPDAYPEPFSKPITTTKYWTFLAIIACLLGMATKETMATAPLIALLYDRTFLSGSFAAALKKRWCLYLGLAATWIFPAVSILRGTRAQSTGNIAPFEYALTQLGVIAHYISLAFWPQNLVLDYYDWPIVRSVQQLHWPAILVALSILLIVILLWRIPWLGFLGAWFFLILAPSSSVLPIFTEIAAEHRMYLSLIAPIALVIIASWQLLSQTPAGAWIASILLTILLATLSARTFLRNAEYQDPQLIWADNATQRPLNPRAHFNLGYSLLFADRPDMAAPEFRKALVLAPDYYAAASALGHALIQSHQFSEAEKFYTNEMIALPAFAPEAHLERGRLRALLNDPAGAQADFQAVTRPSNYP